MAAVRMGMVAGLIVTVVTSLGYPAAAATVDSEKASRAAESIHTVIALDEPLSLARAEAVLERTGWQVVALEHEGPTRGGIRVGQGTSLSELFSAYRSALGERAADVRIFGVRVAHRTKSYGVAAEKVLVRADVTEIPETAEVVFDGTDNSIIPQVTEATEQSSPVMRRSGSAGSAAAVVAPDEPEDWVPDRGRLTAFENPDAPNGLTREMYHTLTWNTAAGIAAFDAGFVYEHDLKMINEDAAVGGVPPACVGPGADDFWADRDALVAEFYETDVPAETVPYFDTRALDSCKQMDWTIGLFEPRNLEAGRQYFIRVLGPPGDAPSSDTRLVAERLPNDCPGDPHIITCINTNLIDDIDPEGETLVQGDPMFTVPGCREWRAESDVSFACVPQVDGMHLFDDGLFDLRFFDEAGPDPTEKRFDRADILQQAAAYNDAISLSMRLLEPWPLSDLRSSDEIRQILDPDGTGGSWPGEAFGWLIDVNGDESPDYEVSVHDDGNEIQARVFHVTTPWDDVCGASASFDGALHTVTIAPSCIGSPDAISVMGYAQRFKRLEGPTDYQYGFDTAPGSGMAPQWSGPIPAPGSSTAATAQPPNAFVPNPPRRSVPGNWTQISWTVINASGEDRYAALTAR